MNAMSKLQDMLDRHEDNRLKPYDDATGKELKPGDVLIGNITVGTGRNLTQVGITSAESLIMLDADIAQTMADLGRNLKWFDALDDARKAALIDMCFNLGWPRFAKFKKTLAALERKDWSAAANEMLRSVWAKQVGSRAVELAAMIKEGKWQK